MISAHITGNLTRDPEVKQGQGGNFTTFDIAVNSKDGAGNKEVTYVGCTANGKTGELVAQYFKKGNTLSIVATLKLRNWTDNSGGKRTELSASTLMIDWEASQSTQPTQQPAAAPPQQTAPAQAARGPVAQPTPAQPPAGQPLFQYDKAGNGWSLINNQWVMTHPARPAAPVAPAAPPQQFAPPQQAAPAFPPNTCPPGERPF